MLHAIVIDLSCFEPEIHFWVKFVLQWCVSSQNKMAFKKVEISS